MDARDLRCFVAVADALSFTKAAERLHMAQPPLSRRIAALEARLGVLLFRRERPLALTEAGRFLADQARQILTRSEDVEAATRRIGAERRRYFGIGFVGSTLYGPLPRAIRQLRSVHPDVEVGLQELPTAQQRTALEERRIDIGFGRLDLGEWLGVTREVLSDEPLRLALARGHQWAGQASLTLSDVAKEPFILYPGRVRPSFADQVLAIFRAERLEPRIALEANDLQTALGLVSADVGVTLVPEAVAISGREDIAFIALEGETAKSPVILSYRSADSSSLLRTFLGLVRNG